VDADGAGVRVDDPMWRGYLTNINSLEFESRFVHQLPEQMTGADFLARYRGTTDAVTRVQPDRIYPVRQATIHPVREHRRVTSFAALLEKLGRADPRDASDDGPRGFATEMGDLMYQSHESYGACGLGSEGTDRLVALVRDAGVARGLFGAKITGGGSGGTVAVFGAEDAEPVVREIAQRYERESGLRAEVFARSGPGAEEVGVVVVSN
jgi:L-arabinokinase